MLNLGLRGDSRQEREEWQRSSARQVVRGDALWSLGSLRSSWSGEGHPLHLHTHTNVKPDAQWYLSPDSLVFHAVLQVMTWQTTISPVLCPSGDDLSVHFSCWPAHTKPVSTEMFSTATWHRTMNGWGRDGGREIERERDIHIHLRLRRVGVWGSLSSS